MKTAKATPKPVAPRPRRRPQSPPRAPAPAPSRHLSAFEPARRRAPVALTSPDRAPLRPSIASVDALARSLAAAPTAATRAGPAAGLTGSPDSIDRRARDAARQEQAQAAARQVDETYRQQGPAAAAAELDAITRSSDDPEFVDAVVQAALPTIEQIGRDIGRDPTSRQARDAAQALGEVANRSSTNGFAAEKIARAIVAGFPENDPSGGLTFYSDAVDSISDAAGPRLALALAAAFGEVGNVVAANRAFEVGIQEVNQAVETFGSTREAREAADARLNAQLAELAPAVLDTPEAVQAYTEQFRLENRDVYQAELDAAVALEETLVRNAPALDAAVATNPSLAPQVLDAWTTLAQGPRPAAALEWAARATRDGSPTAEIFGAHAERIVSGIIEPGVGGTLIQYQADAGGDAAQALDQLEDLFKDFRRSRTLLQLGTRIGAGLDRADEFISALRAAQSGNPQELQDLLSRPGRLQSFNSFETAIAGASLAFAIVNLTESEGLRDILTNVATAGRDGLQILGRAINSLNEAGRLAGLVGGEANAAGAVAFARFASTRIIPAISFALQAASTVDAFRAALADPNAGTLARAVGNSISLIGSGLAIFPPTAPIGAALIAIGTLITLVGSQILGAAERREFNEEQFNILLQVLANELPEDLVNDPGFVDFVERVAYSSLDLNRLVEDAGLNQRQLFELVSSVPDATHRDFGLLIEPLAAAGIQGQALVDNVQAISGFEGDSLILLFNRLASIRQGLVYENPAQWERELAHVAETFLLPIVEAAA